jgi:hypothetical protein
MKHCVCGLSVEEITLPKGIAALSGRQTIFVHVETNNTHCYPDADNEADRSATVVIDEYYEGDE